MSLDCGSKETGTQEINPQDPSGPKIGSDVSLSLQLPWLYYPMSPQILASEKTLRAVTLSEFVLAHALLGGQGCSSSYR